MMNGVKLTSEEILSAFFQRPLQEIKKSVKGYFVFIMDTEHLFRRFSSGEESHDAVKVPTQYSFNRQLGYRVDTCCAQSG